MLETIWPHHCRMPRILFTQQLRRFTVTPEVDTPATTLQGALDAAFAANPQLRGYVLDEQGHVRRHVSIFIDGRRLRDRACLAEPLGAESEIYVMQALTGG